MIGQSTKLLILSGRKSIYLVIFRTNNSMAVIAKYESQITTLSGIASI